VRTAFVETLCELAERDERIWLLCGDLGYSVLERFADHFPERYINVGVAEQNMTGVAAGLALCGKVVFTYSIANFPVMRCLEQIRNDVCYHNLNVKIVAVGGGLSYGAAGYTHYAVEDLAVMRVMPNMTVVAPGDPLETRLATKAVVDWAGPCYLRLGKAGEPVVHQSEPDFAIGKALVAREGTDATLVSTGGTLHAVSEAASVLASQAISVQILSLPTVKPLDEEAVRHAAAKTRLVCVVEEHHHTGGLSDAIARCLLGQADCIVRFMTLDTAALLTRHEAGHQSYLLAQSGLSPEHISAQIAEWIQQARDS
jgi:transketolase